MYCESMIYIQNVGVINLIQNNNVNIVIDIKSITHVNKNVGFH